MAFGSLRASLPLAIEHQDAAVGKLTMRSPPLKNAAADLER